MIRQVSFKLVRLITGGAACLVLLAALATFSAQAQSDVGSNTFQDWVSPPRIVDLRSESRTEISLGITEGVWRDTNGVQHTTDKITVRQNIKHGKAGVFQGVSNRTITRGSDGRYHLTGLVRHGKYVLIINAIVTRGAEQIQKRKMPGRLCFRLTEKGRLNYARHFVGTGCKASTSTRTGTGTNTDIAA